MARGGAANMRRPRQDSGRHGWAISHLILLEAGRPWRHRRAIDTLVSVDLVYILLNGCVRREARMGVIVCEQGIHLAHDLDNLWIYRQLSLSGVA